MIKHGHSRGNNGLPTPTYYAWFGMKKRCLNKKDGHYKNYGARGIKVCDRWLNSFENFLLDMGERPEGTTLDRVNNDGNYEPLNCRWASQIEQHNNKRTNKLVSFNGETLTVAQWARMLGIRTVTIHARMRNGLPTERVLSISDLRKEVA